MKIIYVRHGEVCKENGGLSDVGKNQAQSIVEYIRPENPVKVYCSPQTRAIETAHIIANKLGLNVEVVGGVDERIQPNLEGQQALEFSQNYFNLDYVNPQVQTCKDFLVKNFKTFNEIVARHKEKDENVIVVAHSSTLYALGAYVNGIPQDRQIVWMQCSNCAVVKFFFDAEKVFKEL